VSSTLADNAFLEFGGDGAITGRTGCAALTGTSIVDSDTITVGVIQRTEQPCEGRYLDLAQQLDRAGWATLEGPVTFTIDARTLTLRGADGNGLVLSAAS
jgi:heat shock protein HslJ